MSSTQGGTVYVSDFDATGSLPDGTMYTFAGVLQINGGTEFTDDQAFAIQAALIAAFPADFQVNTGAVPMSKVDSSQTNYQADYSTNPPTFQ